MSENNSVQNAELEKTIDFFGAASILFNIMIGAGIFYLGSLVLMYAGFSQGLACLAWIGGGIVSMLGGLHFAELGTSIKGKRGGGHPVFLAEAYHPIAGYIYNITQIFISSPASTASFALAFMTAFGPAIGLNDTVIKIGAIAFILLIALLNLMGSKIAVLISKFSMILKLLPLLFIIIAGFVAGKVQPDLSLIVEGVGGVGTFSLLLLGINATMWAFSGWQLVPNVSQEMKNPGKDLPKALILGVGGITILYVLFNYAIYRVIPQDTLVTAIQGGDLYQGTAAAKSLFSFGGYLVTFCIMVSVFGSFMSSMMTAARSQSAICSTGRFFKVYGTVSKKGVPLGPVVGQVVGGTLFVIASSLQGLTVLTVFISCVADFLCVLGVVVMRKRYPDLERPFKVPGYKIITPITIIIYVAIVGNTVITNLNNVALAFVAPALAVVLWFVFGKANQDHE